MSIADCRLPIGVSLMDHLNYRINDMNPKMNLSPLRFGIGPLFHYLIQASDEPDMASNFTNR